MSVGNLGYIDVGDGFGRYCHQHPLSFNLSVGYQQPKDITDIEILSHTSKNSHQDKVTNIYVVRKITTSMLETAYVG